MSELGGDCRLPNMKGPLLESIIEIEAGNSDIYVVSVSRSMCGEKTRLLTGRCTEVGQGRRAALGPPRLDSTEVRVELQTERSKQKQKSTADCVKN